MIDIKMHELVQIDHLAFTCKLSDFKQLESAGVGHSNKFKWAELPQIQLSEYLDINVRNEQIEDYQAEFAHKCLVRCKQFITRVLGLSVGSQRGKGLHFYTDSCHIFDAKGVQPVGFLAFGGNENTVYIQLSGTACQHVFTKLPPRHLHFWLSDVLSVTRLSRVDLYFDDFTGEYDTDYALDQYESGAFANPNGGPKPQLDPRRPRRGDIYSGDTVYVGSRKSAVYWRVYDKSLEQKLDATWYRSEVELKKMSVDVLEDVSAAFVSLCEYSAQFANELEVTETRKFRVSAVRASLTLAGKIAWAKRQVGPLLSTLCDHFNGDIVIAYSAVAQPEKTKFNMPDPFRDLINTEVIKEGSHAT